MQFGNIIALVLHNTCLPAKAITSGTGTARTTTASWVAALLRCLDLAHAICCLFVAAG